MYNENENQVGPCGCSTCSCLMGGYQAHLTIDDPVKGLPVVQRYGAELITIKNYFPKSIGGYTEYITSKNYKDLNEALVEMSDMTLALNIRGVNIFRQKIESNPKNKNKKLYTEIHYKVDSFKCGLEDHCFFSKNEKGTLFATERFFLKDPVPRMPKYVMEDVIYDSNLRLDRRLEILNWYL